MKTRKYILLAILLLSNVATWASKSYQTICLGDTITWRNKKYATSGTYTYAYGSTRDTLVLTVNQPGRVILTDTTVCESDLPFEWQDRKYTKAGTYYCCQEGNCEKVHKLVLKITLSPKTRETRYFCKVDGYHHGDSIYYEEKEFKEIHKSLIGCDSIVTINYTMRPYFSIPKLFQHERDSFPVKWSARGKEYYKDGIYFEHYRTNDDCDSVYEVTVATIFDTTFLVVGCTGKSIMHKGVEITKNCIITDSLKTALGADSLLQYRYVFQSPRYYRDTIYICQGDTVEWEGHIDKKTGKNILLCDSGLYKDENRLAGLECDSTYERMVYVSKRYIRDSVVIRCNSDIDAGHPIVWKDHNGVEHKFFKHNIDTMIIDVLPKTKPFIINAQGAHGGGCDSIVRFRAIITDRCSFERIPLCKGSFVIVDSIKYTQPGTYTNKMPSSRGLNLPDSTHSFEIFWADSEPTSDAITICESNLPLIYHDQVFSSTESKNYDVHLKNQYDCDSLVHLRVTVIKNLHSPVHTYKFCPGDTIRIETPTHKVFTTAGEFQDTIHLGDERTARACDSIIHYKIEYIPRFFHSETHFLGKDSAFQWIGHHNDTVYTTAGTYYDSLKNVQGCDSVYLLRLIFALPFYSKDSIKACASATDTLEWHGQKIYTSGTYYDKQHTVYGLDSIYELKATIFPTFNTIKTYSLCHGDTFWMDTVRYFKSTVVRDTLTSAQGCDSVIIHQINFNAATQHLDSAAYVAEGQTFRWHGRDYNRAGHYTDTLHYHTITDNPCDSIIYHLHLHVVRSFLDEQSMTICANELPFDWRGQHISKPGVYTDNLHTTRLQLDSVYKLTVDTLPRSFTSFNVMICKGSTYNFGTHVLTEPGTYRETFISRTNGCDSIVTCKLNYAPQYLYSGEIITYVNDSELPLDWPGHTKKLSGEGYYWDTLKTVEYGCDSIHGVQVIKKEYYSHTEPFTIGNCNLPFKWRGNQYYTSCFDTVKLTSQLGTDSIFVLKLTVVPSDTTELYMTICEGSSYIFGGRELKHTGIYYDSTPNQYGCYDITILHLTTQPIQRTTIDTTLCDGQAIQIGTQSVSQPGTYYHTLQTTLGCDSIITYIVRRGSFYLYEEISINKGETYTWHKDGQPWSLTQTGTYFDSCLAVSGCDSVYCLKLTVNEYAPKFYLDTIVCACNLPFKWQNQDFYRDTVCQVNYQTKLGLDSIYHLNLKIFRVRDSVSLINKCSGEVAEIDGTIYTEPATFNKTIKSIVNGCDSVHIKYILNFYPRYSITQFVELKLGECYTSKGKGTLADTTICTSGTYLRHYRTVTGCDSIVTLIVTACPNIKESTIYVNMCKGEFYDFGGEIITSSTTRTRVVKASDGCDSLATYIINFHDASNTITKASICPGGSYTWTTPKGTKSYTEQGVYVDSVATEAGCYNLYTLQLTYKPSTYADTIVSVCEDNLPYIYKGQEYWADSTFNDTMPNNIYGCDSILRWHYKVNYHCSKYDEYFRCTNEPKYIEGLIITKQGAYFVKRITETGEDSLYRFTVRDVQPYEVFTKHTPACDSVKHFGQTFYARGKGRESFVVDYTHKSIYGCDSIEHRTFTIYSSSPKHTTYATIADYEKYRWENNDYNVPGTYKVQHTNVHNCDSIVELQLTVLTTQYPDPVIYDFCLGDRTGLEIFGKLYFPTSDTIITDTIREGGIPVVRTARVNRHLPFRISQFNPLTDQVVCASNKVVFDVSYEANDKGALPDYYEVDFLVGDLDVEPRHATYPVNGKTMLQIEMDGKGTSVNPGYYSYRIKLGSKVCALSDTTFTGTVTVRYPADIMQANWTNVVTLLNESYNVGHWTLLAPYSWQVKNSNGDDKTALVVSSNNAQPYLASDNLRDGDVVVATLYRSDYYRPIPSCPFVFHPVQSNNYQHPVLIYPTVSAKTSAIHIQTEQSGEYQLYDATGHKCQRGALNEGDNSVLMPAADGCYLIQVTTQDGTERMERIIVH